MLHITYIKIKLSKHQNCTVRGRGIDLRTSQRFRAGDEYTAEDEPTPRLFSFWADQTPVAFYGVATLSQPY